jgi:signal transduction histidine kinase
MPADRGRDLRRRWSALPVMTRDAVGAGLLAALIAVPQLLNPPIPWGVALGVVAALCLALRRAHPAAAILISGACLVLTPLISTGAGGSWVAAAVAVYSAIAWGRRTLGLVAALAETLLLVGVGWLAGAWDRADPIGVALVFAMTVVVGLLVSSRRTALAMAAERLQRAEQARELEAGRAVAEERLRIARELHDVLGHHLAIINVQAAVAEQLLSSAPDAARASLGHVQDATGAAMGELAALVEVLRDPGDQADRTPTPGMAGLDALTAEVRHLGLDLVTTVTGRWPPPLAPMVDLIAYRVVQEALTNAGKYSTGPVQLSLTCGDDQLVIEQTNHVRSSSGGAAAVASGHGLIGMRERVTSVGGRFDADIVGNRFRLRALLPLLALAGSGGTAAADAGGRGRIGT